MYTVKRYILSSLLIICMIAAFLFNKSGLAIQTSAVGVSSENPSSSRSDTLYYGLNQLEDDRLRSAYLKIYDGAAQKQSKIDLSACNITRAELAQVVELYRFDHPEHYWFPSGYAYYSSSGLITSMKITYLNGFDEAAFAQAANTLLAAADGKTTDYDKALALHDALIAHITYDTAAAQNPSGHPNAFHAYGAIVDKKAVCEGYAEAYQYLLQQLGIQSYIVTGYGNGERHEWNLVRLDGEYYYSDITWDDPTSKDEDIKPIFYAYFNITTAQLMEDHTIIDTYGILPNCTDESMMYTQYAKLSQFTVDSVAAAFQSVGNQKIARIYNTGGENFATWFSGNFKAISKKIGATSARYFSCGREFYIVCQTAQSCSHSWKDTYSTDSTMHYHVCSRCGAKDAGQAHSWNVPAATQDTDKHCTVCGYVAQPKLEHTHRGTLVSGSPASCTAPGVKDYYTCTCGKAFEDAACTQEITNLAAWKVIPAAGHSPEADDGDCTTPILCTICGEMTQAGHSSHTGGIATCTEKAHCQRCGTEYGDLLPHSWNAPAATEDTDKHCTVCGYVAEAMLEHSHSGTLVSGFPASCTAPGVKDYYTCTCGKAFEDAVCTQEITDLEAWKVIPAAGHTPEADDGDCTTPILCTICRETVQAGYPTHTGGTATCTQKAHCQRCGTEYGDLLPHSWNVPAATEDTDKHCTVCGYVAEPVIGHIHNATIIDGTPATCTEDGWKDYYACDCGKLFADTSCLSEIMNLEAWKAGDGLVPQSGHKDQNGDETCDACGEDMAPSQNIPEGTTGTSTPAPTPAAPKPNPISGQTLLIAVIFVAGAIVVAVVVTIVKAKRQQ